MRILENASGSRKVCVWKDEMQISYVGKKSFCKSIASGGVDWYAGTLCIEAKLHPRHVSNYAMICMRYG